jgi:hypothetical protein
VITIQPQYLTFSKLLDGRLFQIPEYQRAYSWTSREREDLFNDIKRTHAKGSDEGHFMAAVVCLRRKKQVLGTDEFFVMEVVDGQQRLTTLIILLNAIKLELNNEKKTEAKLAVELGNLLVKPEGDELLLLQTNHDSSHHFANFLWEGKAPPSDTASTLADREILKAIEECRAFVSDWQIGAGSLTVLIGLLKNHLFFLLHEIDDEKMVYTVFDVLNSRGLEVSSLDRLKSNLMGTAFELKNANQRGVITNLHNTWRGIYSVTGLRQGWSTEALRFSATLHAEEPPSRPLGEDDSVDQLRSKATTAKSIREVASWLLSVTKACDVAVESKRTEAVTRISQARLLAAAIILRDDFKPTERTALLGRWEKVSFRIYGMLGNDARKRVGDYVRLAWSVINEKLSVKEIDAAIAEIGADFPIDEAIDELRKANCYEDWESELRYMMFRYEEHLAKQQKLNITNEQWLKIWMASPAESIEHIWAKSKAPERHRHRLGNLVLLPPRLNSKLQDDRAKDKAAAYRDTGLLIAREVANMIDSRGWNTKAIADREESLLAWATTEWSD